MWLKFFVLFLPLFLHAGPKVKRDRVEVQIVTPQSQIAHGQVLRVGVHYKMEKDWHIYWKNPGDSGASPKFDVEGGSVEKIYWPYPHRIPVADFTNFGYDIETAILLDLKPRPDAKNLKLKLEWLICKVECIPGFADFMLPLPLGPVEKLKPLQDPDRQIYDRYANLIPPKSSRWSVSGANFDGDNLQFQLAGAPPSQVKEVFVFPEERETLLTLAPVIDPLENVFRVSVPVSVNATDRTGPFDFTFVIVDNSGRSESFEATVHIQQKSGEFFLGLLFAFLGGIILNLMPCVFPVLSLKLFGFLKEKNPKIIRSSSWSYTVGVLVTFTAIGGLLMGLRLSGESIGWGYQLQSPWLVYLLAFLFFIMALSFLDFLPMGNSLANSAGKLGQRKFLSGSFGTGVLAVIVASPCTAPFMGGALGLTLLLPWYQSLFIFFFLGLGMAAPFLALSYAPGLISWLPRSGLWMETLKQFFAFPMLATSVWLLWVLSLQKGSDSVILAISSFLVVGFLVWLARTEKIWVKRLSFTVMFVLVAYFASQIHKLEAITAETKSANASAWHSFDAKDIQDKIGSQRVFVDFTASWCITCQVNKKAVLDTDEVQELFKKNNIYLVRADWTNRNSEITKALEKFGRNSVPVYAFYDGNKAPRVLPQLLTKEMIFDLVNNTGDTGKGE